MHVHFIYGCKNIKASAEATHDPRRSRRFSSCHNRRREIPDDSCFSPRPRRATKRNFIIQTTGQHVERFDLNDPTHKTNTRFKQTGKQKNTRTLIRIDSMLAKDQTLSVRWVYWIFSGYDESFLKMIFNKTSERGQELQF